MFSKEAASPCLLCLCPDCGSFPCQRIPARRAKPFQLVDFPQCVPDRRLLFAGKPDGAGSGDRLRPLQCIRHMRTGEEVKPEQFPARLRHKPVAEAGRQQNERPLFRRECLAFTGECAAAGVDKNYSPRRNESLIPGAVSRCADSLSRDEVVF